MTGFGHDDDDDGGGSACEICGDRTEMFHPCNRRSCNAERKRRSKRAAEELGDRLNRALLRSIPNPAADAYNAHLDSVLEKHHPDGFEDLAFDSGYIDEP